MVVNEVINEVIKEDKNIMLADFEKTYDTVMDRLNFCAK